MQGLLRRRGIALALYTDRHPVFKHRSEHQLAGTTTQFGRAIKELGTQLIFALSPQAKGRVERTAGTFQDRLITELRLAGATTVEQAKAVLQQFPGQCPEPAFRPFWSGVRAWGISCVSNTAGEWRGDNTVTILQATPCKLLPTQQTPQIRRSGGRGAGGLDGRLSLQHERTHHRFPGSNRPVPASLRSRNETFPSCHHPNPRPRGRVKNLRLKLSNYRAQSRIKKKLALRQLTIRTQPGCGSSHRPGGRRFLLQERWKAVQQAKLQGMSIRRMARELGIHRGHGEEIHRRRDSADAANSSKLLRHQHLIPSQTRFC